MGFHCAQEMIEFRVLPLQDGSHCGRPYAGIGILKESPQPPPGRSRVLPPAPQDKFGHPPGIAVVPAVSIWQCKTDSPGIP